jgi:cytochrome oxidase Cu insertion factor (SCO1/SenC/PrrC family)
VRRVLILGAVAVLAACGGRDEAESPARTASAAPAREVAGQTLDGKRLALSDFRGKPVVVNVWSSW